MNAVIFIEPHERFDAVDAYRHRLNPVQIEAILDAEDGALIRLDIRAGKTEIMIIEEG